MFRSNTIRLYKFYPSNTALLNLESKKLKISRINELNDPFEAEPFLLADKRERDYWRKCKNQISTIAGSISFCERWDNPLMWAHYADQHKGLCLGFDVKADLANKVVYRSHRKTLKSVQNFIDKKDFEAMKFTLTTKFGHWEYEQEHRIFSALDTTKPIEEMQFEHFSNEILLTSVIIGVRSNVSSNQIRAIVAPNVKIISARMAFRSFRICAQHSVALQK